MLIEFTPEELDAIRQCIDVATEGVEPDPVLAEVFASAATAREKIADALNDGH